MTNLHLDRSSYRLLTALALVGVIALGGTVAYKQGGVGADTLSGDSCQLASSTTFSINAQVNFGSKPTGSDQAQVTIAADNQTPVTQTVSPQRNQSSTQFLNLKSGNYSIQATHVDGRLSNREEVELNSKNKNLQNGEATVQLSFSPTHQLSGKVLYVDQAGQPIPGMTVGSGTVSAEQSDGQKVTTTIVNGQFSSMKLIANQSYRVTAQDGQNHRSQTETITLSNDKTNLELKIKADTTAGDTIIKGKILGVTNGLSYGASFKPGPDNSTRLGSSATTTANEYRSSTLTKGGWYVKASAGDTNRIGYESRWQYTSLGANEQKTLDIQVSPKIQTLIKKITYPNKATALNLFIYESEEQANFSEKVNLSVGSIAGTGYSVSLLPGNYVVRGTATVNNKPRTVTGSFSVPTITTKPYQATVDNLNLADKTSFFSTLSLKPTIQQLMIGLGIISPVAAAVPANTANCAVIKGYVIQDTPAKSNGHNHGLNDAVVTLIANNTKKVIATTKTVRNETETKKSDNLMIYDGYFEFKGLDPKLTYTVQAGPGDKGMVSRYAFSDDANGKPLFRQVSAEATDGSKVQVSFAAGSNIAEVKPLLKILTTSFTVNATWSTDALKRGEEQAAKGDKGLRSEYGRLAFTCTYQTATGKAPTNPCPPAFTEKGAPIHTFAERYQAEIASLNADVNIAFIMNLESEKDHLSIYDEVGKAKPARTSQIPTYQAGQKTRTDKAGKYRVIIGPEMRYCMALVDNAGTVLKNRRDYTDLSLQIDERFLVVKEVEAKADDSGTIKFGLNDVLDLYPSANKGKRIIQGSSLTPLGVNIYDCKAAPGTVGKDPESVQEVIDLLYP